MIKSKHKKSIIAIKKDKAQQKKELSTKKLLTEEDLKMFLISFSSGTLSIIITKLIFGD